MPLATAYLIALARPGVQISSLLAALPSKPLVQSRVIRWIVLPSTPERATPLTTHPWDLLLIFPSTVDLSASLLTSHGASASYSITFGIPSKLLASFADKNAKYLNPGANDVPALTGALDKPRIADSAQTLALTDELLAWAHSWDQQTTGVGGRGAVSQLNLLAFAEGKHGEYVKYGQAFAASAGSSRGGDAKVVGRIVPQEQKVKEPKGAGLEAGGGAKGWEELALAHYPSIWHFADMLASEDYQEANLKYRVGSLKDTCILMTSEVVLAEELSAAKMPKGKL